MTELKDFIDFYMVCLLTNVLVEPDQVFKMACSWSTSCVREITSGFSVLAKVLFNHVIKHCRVNISNVLCVCPLQDDSQANSLTENCSYSFESARGCEGF